MGTIARGMKSSGGTALTDSYDVLAAELNADFDTIFTEINGNLNSTNIAVGGVTSAALASGISQAKIDDYSATATEAKIETNPDVSSSESLATTLQGELERIRYVLKRQSLGGRALHYAGAANLSTYWGDYSVRGPNLVRNNSFEVKTTIDGSAPDGWTIVGTPTVLTTAPTDTSNGKGKCISITGDDTIEGIQQAITGLKKSTHYFVQCRYVTTVGTMVMVTSGADVTSNFRDITINGTSATWDTMSAVVKTDSSATAITLNFITLQAADAFKVDDVTFQEMDKEIVVSPKTIVVRDSSTTAGALSNAEGVFPAGDGLTAAVTVPSSGCTISVRACCRIYPGASTQTFTGLLREVASTGPTTTEVDVASTPAFDKNSTMVTLGYTNTNPTPGDTYTYSTRSISYATSGTANGANWESGTKTLLSWLEVTLHVPS